MGHSDVVQDIHVAPQGQVLEGSSQSPGGNFIGFKSFDGIAFQVNFTLGGGVHPGDEIENGGLAGTVGADESGDLPGFDAQTVVVYRTKAAEIVGHAVNA